MYVLKHLGVFSLAKMMALFGLLEGILYAALFLSVAPALPGYTASSMGPVVMIVAGIVGGIAFGFLCGAIIAFLYNVFARLIGGVHIDLS